MVVPFKYEAGDESLLIVVRIYGSMDAVKKVFSGENPYEVEHDEDYLPAKHQARGNALVNVTFRVEPGLDVAHFTHAGLDGQEGAGLLHPASIASQFEKVVDRQPAW